MSPATFQDWKDTFLQGGKQALAGGGGAAKNHAKEVENLKRIIGEMANDICEMKLRAVREASSHMSLLTYCGMSKCGKSSHRRRCRPQGEAGGLTASHVRDPPDGRANGPGAGPTNRKKIQRIYRPPNPGEAHQDPCLARLGFGSPIRARHVRYVGWRQDPRQRAFISFQRLRMVPRHHPFHIHGQLRHALQFQRCRPETLHYAVLFEPSGRRSLRPLWFAQMSQNERPSS